MRSKKGFTLVEMLVTIGIVGALAAVVLPAMGSARRKAREMTCMNNLRQVVNSYIGAYPLSHGGRFLVDDDYDGKSSNRIRNLKGPVHLGKLYSELQTLDVLACPESSLYPPKVVKNNWAIAEANPTSILKANVYTSYILRGKEDGASPNQELNGFHKADGNTAIVGDFQNSSSAKSNINHRDKGYVGLRNGAVLQVDAVDATDTTKFWQEIDGRTR